MDDDGAWAEDSINVRINGIPHVNDILLNNNLIMEDEFIDAEVIASDDFGIAGYEWSLDGEVLNIGAISEEQPTITPPSSWESQNGDMIRTREWVEIGSWYSNTLMEDINLQDKSFQLHIFWSETEEGREDDYDAQVQYRFRVYIDGQETVYYTDENNGTNHECPYSEPCEWIGSLESLNLTQISQGSTVEIVIEYWAFSDIEIHALDVEFDSALSFDFDDSEISIDSSSPTLHLEDLSIGVHNLSVRVIDSDGVWSEPFNVEFRVNGFPTAVIESVDATVFVEQYNVEGDPRYTEVNLIGNGIDDLGIASCEWKGEYLDSNILGENIPDRNWPIDGSCSVLEIRDFVAGNYTFSLRVMDTDGIWSGWIYHPAIYVDDGDAYDYTVDVFPYDNNQWFDRDKDGCGDNNWDAFPDDPTECLDTDGDGIGDNSDILPSINNTYVYGATSTLVVLIGAALAEYSARKSIPELLEGLENLNSMGVTDELITQAIQNLQNPSGSQFFSSDLSEAKNLLENYSEFTGDASQSIQELDALKAELAQMEAEGITDPNITKDIGEIEQMIDSEIVGETNQDYLESLKERKIE